ncbi:MAG: nucleotidyltransferase family protein [Candidatus Magnetobacterium sp. LHC-1]|uniref:Nucleotidyltransferase family protein n=1 Tax=Candidatus Magnetobacterium casense TaxID=1455061 RepID=A0ABS6RX08_9BACT|nr:nucleotidyltransferase family protein [Candidatus Magnetobacterium casensis]MBF0608218.1 nucleotidyltransferase family protein [Nitrospirota bacterium]MBV6341160.1 nucleotidyltransferase family protein [Candidatus Magnetobacterium casensis]
MKNLEEIKSTIRLHKEELVNKYKVREIGIFGSYARAEQTRRSDIDILVEFDEVPDLLKFIEIERYLQKILRKKVDLVRKSAVRPELRERILNETVII